MRAEQEGSSGSAAALGPIQTENNYLTPTHPVDVSDRGVTSQGEVYSDSGKVPFEGTVISPDGSVSLTPAQRKVLAGTATAFVGLTVAGALGAYKAGSVEAADIHEAVTTSPTPRTATFEGHPNPYAHLFSTEKVQPKATPTAQPQKEEDKLRKPEMKPLDAQLGGGEIQPVSVTVESLVIPKEQLVPLNNAAMTIVEDPQSGVVKTLLAAARFESTAGRPRENMSIFVSQLDQTNRKMTEWVEESGPQQMGISAMLAGDNWRMLVGTKRASEEPQIRFSTGDFKTYVDVPVKTAEGVDIIMAKVLGGEQVPGTRKVLLGMESTETNGSLLMVDLDNPTVAKKITWDKNITVNGPVIVGSVSADKKTATVYARAFITTNGTETSDNGFIQAQVNLETGTATVKRLAEKYRPTAFLPIKTPEGVKVILLSDNRSGGIIAKVDANTGETIYEIPFGDWVRKLPGYTSNGTFEMFVSSIQTLNNNVILMTQYATGNGTAVARISYDANTRPTLDTIQVVVVENQSRAAIRTQEQSIKANMVGVDTIIADVDHRGLILTDGQDDTWIDKHLGGRYGSQNQNPTSTATTTPTPIVTPTPTVTPVPSPAPTPDGIVRPFKAFLSNIQNKFTSSSRR